MGITLTRMLKETDIEDTARFYADSAKYVPYFQNMFGVTDCTEELYALAGVWLCLKTVS